MFWLQPVGEIWVLLNGSAPDSGEWLIFLDIWEEGMPALDPNLIAPDGLYQPERGFGRLWREEAEVAERLGWAVDTEYGYVPLYRYEARGSVTEDGEYLAQPGVHYLTSRSGEVFAFDVATMTWRLIPDAG